MVALRTAEPTPRPRSRDRDPSPVNEPDHGGADFDSPALGLRAFLGPGERRVQFGEVEREGPADLLLRIGVRPIADRPRRGPAAGGA